MDISGYLWNNTLPKKKDIHIIQMNNKNLFEGILWMIGQGAEYLCLEGHASYTKEIFMQHSKETDYTRIIKSTLHGEESVNRHRLYRGRRESPAEGFKDGVTTNIMEK